MFGREGLDREQADLMVIQALREATMDPDLNVEEGDNPDLAEDLGIDEICMSDLIVALEREFEVQVSDEDAEEWFTFNDVVLGMISIHNNSAEDSSCEKDFDDEEE